MNSLKLAKKSTESIRRIRGKLTMFTGSVIQSPYHTYQRKKEYKSVSEIKRTIINHDKKPGKGKSAREL